MITIKTDADLQRMDAAGRVVEETLRLLKTLARPGVTTAELDHEAERFIRSRGAMLERAAGATESLGRAASMASRTGVRSTVTEGMPNLHRLPSARPNARRRAAPTSASAASLVGQTISR